MAGRPVRPGWARMAANQVAGCAKSGGAWPYNRRFGAGPAKPQAVRGRFGFADMHPDAYLLARRG